MALSDLTAQSLGFDGWPLQVTWQGDQASAPGFRTLSYGTPSTPKLSMTFDFGTGNNQCNKAYNEDLSLATLTGTSIDLSGSLSDGVGGTAVFTAIKAIIISISNPASNVELRVGPQGVANAYQGSFGDLSDYMIVRNWALLDFSPLTGWPVSAGTADLLRIYNPSGLTVNYNLLILGV